MSECLRSHSSNRHPPPHPSQHVGAEVQFSLLLNHDQWQMGSLMGAPQVTRVSRPCPAHPSSGLQQDGPEEVGVTSHCWQVKKSRNQSGLSRAGRTGQNTNNQLGRTRLRHRVESEGKEVQRPGNTQPSPPGSSLMPFPKGTSRSMSQQDWVQVLV